MISSNNQAKKFAVIQFVDDLPHESACNFICIPRTWIHEQLTLFSSDLYVSVAYPSDEDPKLTSARVRNQENYKCYWKLWSAIVKYETDDYDNAQFWITTNDIAALSIAIRANTEKTDEFIQLNNLTMVDTDKNVDISPRTTPTRRHSDNDQEKQHYNPKKRRATVPMFLGQQNTTISAIFPENQPAIRVKPDNILLQHRYFGPQKGTFPIDITPLINPTVSKPTNKKELMNTLRAKVLDHTPTHDLTKGKEIRYQRTAYSKTSLSNTRNEQKDKQAIPTSTSQINASQINASQINASQINASQINASQINATQIRQDHRRFANSLQHRNQFPELSTTNTYQEDYLKMLEKYAQEQNAQSNDVTNSASTKTQNAIKSIPNFKSNTTSETRPKQRTAQRSRSLITNKVTVRNDKQIAPTNTSNDLIYVPSNQSAQSIQLGSNTQQRIPNAEVSNKSSDNYEYPIRYCANTYYEECLQMLENHSQEQRSGQSNEITSNQSKFKDATTNTVQIQLPLRVTNKKDQTTQTNRPSNDNKLISKQEPNELVEETIMIDFNKYFNRIDSIPLHLIDPEDIACVLRHKLETYAGAFQNVISKINQFYERKTIEIEQNKDLNREVIEIENDNR